MRWVVVSVAVHALVVLLWLSLHGNAESPSPVESHAQPHSNGLTEETPMVVEMISMSSGGGSSASSRASRAAHIGSSRARASNPWAGLSVTTEGAGTGTGTGAGGGTGSGIGFGDGGGVRAQGDVPPPPAPPPVSKARPARLIWPNRDVEVVDDSYLFVAKVTVDADGSVAGARMITSRPGSRADHAANAIWTFRYAPALDDDGRPIRSTFEQSFQVR